MLLEEADRNRSILGMKLAAWRDVSERVAEKVAGFLRRLDLDIETSRFSDK